MTPAALAIAISLLTLGAFLVSAASTAGMIRLAPRIGLVDKPGHRKIHHVPKPLGGGVGIFLGVAVPMLVGVALVLTIPVKGLAGLVPDPGLLTGARQQI